MDHPPPARNGGHVVTYKAAVPHYRCVYSFAPRKSFCHLSKDISGLSESTRDAVYLLTETVSPSLLRNSNSHVEVTTAIPLRPAPPPPRPRACAILARRQPARRRRARQRGGWCGRGRGRRRDARRRVRRLPRRPRRRAAAWRRWRVRHARRVCFLTSLVLFSCSLSRLARSFFSFDSVFTPAQ